MEFIEVDEGFSIKVSEIEAIERIDDLNCAIYTHHNRYEMGFPYKTLLDLLSLHTGESDSMRETMKSLKGFLEQSGHFVG